MKDFNNHITNQKEPARRQAGQVIIVLLLIMLGALTVGLAITQRSITDVATSTQTEQSSRAFSAAEAGIEKILSPNSAITPGTPLVIKESELGNQSSASAKLVNNLPRTHQALEYPPIGKETVAQFWLVPPLNPPLSMTLAQYNAASYPAYKANQVDVYFGNPELTIDAAALSSVQTPALEINVVTKDFASADPLVSYKSHRYFIDPLAGRRTSNGFSDPNCPSAPTMINTTNSANTSVVDRQFRCKITVPFAADLPPGGGPNALNANERMVLIRVRTLYSDNNQSIAVQPLGISTDSLPPQVKIYTSIGTSGPSQKVIQVFKMDNVSSPFFDYALFSAQDIRK